MCKSSLDNVNHILQVFGIAHRHLFAPPPPLPYNYATLLRISLAGEEARVGISVHVHRLVSNFIPTPKKLVVFVSNPPTSSKGPEETPPGFGISCSLTELSQMPSAGNILPHIIAHATATVINTSH